jgi:hypothetical protein
MKLEPKFVSEVYKFYNLLVYKDNGDEIVKQIMEFKPTTEITGETEQEIYNYLQTASKQIIYSTKESNLTTFCVKTEIDMVCRCYGHTVFECLGCSLGWTWRIRVITVPCTNGDEGGGPGNGSSSGSPIGGSPGDGGGGGPSSTINNENEIIASPVVPGLDGVIAPIEDPCVSLKKLFENDPLSPTIKPNIIPNINILTDQASSNLNNEVGYYFSKDSNGLYASSDLIIPQNSDNTVPIKLNNNTYAVAHTHTALLYSMFSWKDVYALHELYRQADAAYKTEITLLLVSKECLTCATVNVYALKIENFNAFRYKLQTDLNNVRTAGFTDDQKTDYASKTFEEKFNLGLIGDTPALEKLFLEEFSSFGLSLYKANDDLNNWNKLTLSSIPLNPINEIPCN